MCSVTTAACGTCGRRRVRAPGTRRRRRRTHGLPRGDFGVQLVDAPDPDELYEELDTINVLSCYERFPELETLNWLSDSSSDTAGDGDAAAAGACGGAASPADAGHSGLQPATRASWSATRMARADGGELAASAGMLPPDAGELAASAGVEGACGRRQQDLTLAMSPASWRRWTTATVACIRRCRYCRRTCAPCTTAGPGSCSRSPVCLVAY